MIHKICADRACDDLAIAGLRHCELHEAERQQRRAVSRAQAKMTPEQQLRQAQYKLAAWVKASKLYLKQNPYCIDCWELGAPVNATQVDHIKRWENDLRLFWDKKNWQALCQSCHSRKTANEVWHGK